MRTTRRIFLFLIVTLLTGTAGAESARTLTNTQKLFLSAEQAIKQGQVHRYQALRNQLENYPLIPYLEYEALRRRLSHTTSEDIEAFLSRYSDTPLSDRLYYAWINSLARQGRWQKLIDAYHPGSSTNLECLYRRGLYKTGHQEQALDGLERLWLVGHSQPRSCDPLFKAWHDIGLMSQDYVWQRFALAMQAGRSGLARYLIRFLDENEQPWGRLWLQVHYKPAQITVSRQFQHYHPMRNAILLHGVKRLAHNDPDAAVAAWQQLLDTGYQFNDQEKTETERRLAMSYALRGRPEASSWLAAVNVSAEDTRIPEWRIRAALDQQHWDAVLAWIYLLKDEEQQTSRWQYWKARALRAQGQVAAADEIFLALSQNRSYYGFLSADQLELPYRFEERPIDPGTNEQLALDHYPGLQRAHELYELGRIVDARREWFHATQYFSEHQLQQAAVMAHEWGWHDRAIMTLARSNYRDDLNIRFPLAYEDIIKREAKATDIDPALAFAVIRQESAFTSDARSHAGALGLMQLMPQTARLSARRMGMALHSRMALIDAETNLKLGMHYLHNVLMQYNNNMVLATAAYNAGEYRVNKWIPEHGSEDADIWTETMPFTETRQYVQNILLFMTIYDQRLGRQPTPLKMRMPPVSALGTFLADSIDRVISPPDSS